MEVQEITQFRRRLFKERTKALKDPRVMVYFLVFIYALHITPASYIHSTFLEQFTGSKYVGYVFTITAVLTIGGLVLAKRFLQFLGNYRTFMTVLAINFLSLLFMSYSIFIKDNRIWGFAFVVAYIIGSVCRTIGFLCIDIFLEHYSDDKDTGGIRGLFLTAMNFAILIGPFIAGVLVTSVIDSGRVYVWAAACSLVVILISRKHFKGFKDSRYKKSDLFKTFLKMRTRPNLYKIFMTNLILMVFYSWMVIYTPIFLREYIGFSLSEVAMIIGIALIPFIIFQIPLGRIADKKFGETEILTIGFLIAGVATFAMAFMSLKSFVLWASILFIGRIGASAIEIMNESYLFKKINDDDINILGLYRIIRPLAYTFSPLVASLILFKFSSPVLFLVLGVILIWGIRYSLTIEDTM